MLCFRIFRIGLGGPAASIRPRILSLNEAALTAGSAPDNDLVLEDPAIPKVAFRLTLEEECCTVTAAGLGAELAVNGRRTASARLRPGDRLELGSLALILDTVPEEEEDSRRETDPAASIGSGGAFHDHLARLCTMVAEERDLAALLGKLMELLQKAFGGNQAFLFTLDASGNPEAFVASHRDPALRERLFSDTVVSQVLKSRMGLCLANAMANPAFSQSESIIGLQLHSVLCCPIVVGGRMCGLIYLGSNQPSVSFREADLRELELYAMVAGCLINHVAFINRQEKVLESLREGGDTAGWVAFCPPMKKVQDELRAVAASDISILLTGETGTGKDLAAGALHRMSRRAKGPFQVVNCGTLRGELLASELFGHRKGAFTGAVTDQKGLFAAADGGTLFLDEVGEMDLPLQAMLLRALEIGKVRPVGQSAEISVDVRIVCATNRDLEDMVAKGTFRRDLFYRINQHSVKLPALRERGDDILVLAHFFLEKARAAYPDKRLDGFHPDSLAAMAAHDWPGNVRELANAVHKSVIFAASPLVRVVGIPEAGGGAAQDDGMAPDYGRDAKASWLGLEDATRAFQRDYIKSALAHCSGDKEQAAALLNVARSTFFRYLTQVRVADAAD